MVFTCFLKKERNAERNAERKKERKEKKKKVPINLDLIGFSFKKGHIEGMLCSH